MNFLTVFETQWQTSNHSELSLLFKEIKVDNFVFVPQKYGFANKFYQIEALNEITRLRPDAKIWIGTPGINSGNFKELPSLKTMTTYLKDIYNALTHPKQVAGIYYNQESLYGDIIYATNTNTFITMNPQVTLMQKTKQALIDIIGKDTMLWIPYYGYGGNAATIIKNIGYVADGTKIFDYVCMQPHYLFEPSLSQGNFNGIISSMQYQEICYRNAVKAYPGSSNTKTKIGFEVEYSQAPQYYKNFPEYIKNLKPLRGDYPYVIYWQMSGCSLNEYQKMIEDLNNFICG